MSDSGWVSQASSWLSICRHFWMVLEGPGVGFQVQTLQAAFFRHIAELSEHFFTWISEKYVLSLISVSLCLYVLASWTLGI